MTFSINRSVFRQCIAEAVNSCADGQHFAVVVIKLVELHKINRLRGYDHVDTLVTNALDSLTSMVRKTSATCYLGNSTFGLLIKELKFPNLIQIGVERALDAVRGPHTLDGQSTMLEAVAGVAVFPQDGGAADRLFMYAEAGALQSEWPDSSAASMQHPNSLAIDRWQLEMDLKSAVQEQQFSLNYQPQIRLKDGSTAGFEALLRWHHPDHGMIPPDDFLPLAESGGMMGDITEWLIQTGLCEFNRIPNKDEKMTVSVNISTPILLDPGFPYLVDSAVSLWDASYDQLVIEITESVLIKDFESSVKVLSALRSKGVGISIDDFGTGYSSFSYFKNLPADELKIDRLFVKNLATDEQDRKLVEALIHLAHNFNLKIVAEGIEDQPTLDALREMGCDIAQGYFISKPLDSKQMYSWCADKKS